MAADTVAQIDSFFRHYGNISYDTKRVIHGDLTDDHILLSSTGALAGIIDFADAVLGDPARDFCYAWRYGEWVPEMIYERYQFKSDPGLLNRSRWHSLRFTIDDFFAALRDNRNEYGQTLIAILESELKTIFSGSV
jgi:aminoglycoside phosphotransferase (APT) family kinase protein